MKKCGKLSKFEKARRLQIETLEDRALLSAIGLETVEISADNAIFELEQNKALVPNLSVLSSEAVLSSDLIQNSETVQLSGVHQNAAPIQESSEPETYTVSESQALPISGAGVLTITNTKATNDESYEIGDILQIALTTPLGNEFSLTQLRVWHSDDGINGTGYWIEDKEVTSETTWTHEIDKDDIGHYLLFEAGYTFEGDSNVYFSVKVTSSKVIAGGIDEVAIISSTEKDGKVYYSAAGSSSVLSVALTPTMATATYQWYRNGEEISGATGANYTITLLDVGSNLSVKATGSGDWIGSAVAALPDKVYGLITSVSLDNNNPTAGMTLKASCISASADTDNSVLYTWYRLPAKNSDLKDEYKIQSGIGTNTYVLNSNDVGKYIYVLADGTENWTTLKTISTVSEKVTGSFTAAFTANSTSNLTMGNTLTVQLTNSANGETISDSSASSIAAFKWYRDSQIISGATNSSYTLTATDVGHKIKAVISGAANSGWNSNTTLTLITDAIVTGELSDVSITYTEPMSAGTVLRSNVNPAGGNYTYQWYYAEDPTAETENWLKISGATQNNYSLTENNLNTFVKVVVSGSGWTNSVEAIQSTYVTRILTLITTSTSTPKIGETITLGLFDQDNAMITNYNGINFEWYYSNSQAGPFTLITTIPNDNNYTITNGDLTGKYLKVIVKCNTSTICQGTAELSYKNAIAAADNVSPSQAVFEETDLLPALNADLSEFEFDPLLVVDVSVMSKNGSTVSEWTIRWGDEKEGDSGQTVVYDSFSIRLVHYYEKNGDYQISLCINNKADQWENYTYLLGTHKVTKSAENNVVVEPVSSSDNENHANIENKNQTGSDDGEKTPTESTATELTVSESPSVVNEQSAALLLAIESEDDDLIFEPVAEILNDLPLVAGKNDQPFCPTDALVLNLIQEDENDQNQKQNRLYESLLKTSAVNSADRTAQEVYFESLLDEVC